jgi:hypothetical protein
MTGGKKLLDLIGETIFFEEEERKGSWLMLTLPGQTLVLMLNTQHSWVNCMDSNGLVYDTISCKRTTLKAG